MEGRKWEELDMDCVVNIFGRVGIESLILDVPYVCKPWYQATLNPLCWQRLVFPDDLKNSRFGAASFQYNPNRSFKNSRFQRSKPKRFFNAKKLIMFVVKRSQRCATDLLLPKNCTADVLTYAADECPALKLLMLPIDGIHNRCNQSLPWLIRKWKNLEMLRLGSSINMQKIIAQIIIHCNNFVGLSVTKAYIGIDEAISIVNFLPKIKYLFLKKAHLGREELVIILKGCKKLVHLDVSYCIGFDIDDDILKIASHITSFKYEGSGSYFGVENPFLSWFGGLGLSGI